MIELYPAILKIVLSLRIVFFQIGWIMELVLPVVDPLVELDKPELLFNKLKTVENHAMVLKMF